MTTGLKTIGQMSCERLSPEICLKYLQILLNLQKSDWSGRVFSFSTDLKESFTDASVRTKTIILFSKLVNGMTVLFFNYSDLLLWFKTLCLSEGEWLFAQVDSCFKVQLKISESE